MFGQKKYVKKLRLQVGIKLECEIMIQGLQYKIKELNDTILANKNYNKKSSNILTYERLLMKKTEKESFLENSKFVDPNALSLSAQVYSPSAVKFAKKELNDIHQQIIDLIQKDKDVEKFAEYTHASQEKADKQKKINFYQIKLNSSKIQANQLKAKIRKIPQDLKEYV